MRLRLLLTFVLIILIALGSVALLARYTTRQEVTTFLGHGGQAGLENLAHSLEAYYAQNGSWTGVTAVLDGGQGKGPGRGIGNTAAGSHILLDADGVILISPTPSEVGSRLPSEDLARSIPLEVRGQIVGYLQPEGGLAELPENFESLLIERVNRASLLSALISGGIAIILALVMSAVVIRPIRKLTRAAGSLAAGDLSERVSVKGGDELADLANAFNQMAESLQDAEKRRRAMTADIAHELRNPLAVQRAHLEALQDGLYPLNEENLEQIMAQNLQLTHMVEDLRTLALADAGELPLNKRRTDLTALCMGTLSRFEPQTRAKGLHLAGDCPERTIEANVDPERIRQILDNLMQNAIRHTPPNGAIQISLQSENHDLIIQVRDSGPGIPEAALPHLFERFYRVDKGRDRTSGGTGLGLAIARQLAEAHDGSLTAANNPEGGAVFTLHLPLEPSARI
jgi:signal transduction histidine kinase